MPRMGWPIVVIAGSWPIELSRLFMLQCWRRGRSSPTVFMTRHLSAFLRRIEFTSDLFLRQNFIPIDIFIRRNNISDVGRGLTSFHSFVAANRSPGFLYKSKWYFNCEGVVVCKSKIVCFKNRRLNPILGENITVKLRGAICRSA